MSGNSIERLKRSDFHLSLIIAIITITIHSLLTIRLNSLGVFDQYNVIFDDDPNRMKSLFANGWGHAGFLHPLLPYFFSVPIRAIASIASISGAVNDEVVFREILALYISPTMSAIKALSLFLTFRLLRLRIVDAVLATAIGVLSFSSLIFGSIPSSYVVSGAGLSLITLVSLLNCFGTTRLKKACFVLSGFISIGTTVSNVTHYGWMTWMVLIRQGRKLIPALIRSIVGAAILAFIILMLSGALGFLREGSTDDFRLTVPLEFIDKYTPSVSEQISNGARFPEMLARSFIPTEPSQKVNILAQKNGDPIKFELTFNETEIGLVSFVLWLVGIMIIGGVVVCNRLGDLWRWVGFASAASLLTSGLVFSWFGTNTFLFSQYWQVPGTILIGAWVHYIAIRFKFGRGIIAVFVAGLAIGDLYIFSIIDGALTSFK
jgi:hypothetical protein